MHLKLSTPGRQAFPEDDPSFTWFKHCPPVPPNQESKHSRVEATGTFIQLREGYPGEEEAWRP